MAGHVRDNPYETPTQPSPDALEDAEGESNHDGSLVSIAVIGMACLGVTAMMAQWVKEGWLTRWWHPHDPFLTLLLCGGIGAVVGVSAFRGWFRACGVRICDDRRSSSTG